MDLHPPALFLSATDKCPKVRAPPHAPQASCPTSQNNVLTLVRAKQTLVQNVDSRALLPCPSAAIPCYDFLDPGLPQGNPMRSKWFRRIKRFIELFTPGGTEYTPSGIAIVYSRTGVTHIPRSEYKKLLCQYLSRSNDLHARLRDRHDEETSRRFTLPWSAGERYSRGCPSIGRRSSN
jgi:hypothetical protein